MRYPNNIKKVETLDTWLQQWRIDLNCYWHLIMKMKIVIAEQVKGTNEQVATLIYELRKVPKKSYFKPDAVWKKKRVVA